MPLTLALQRGEWAGEDRFEIEVVQLQNGSQVADGLARGELDAGLGGHLQTLSAALAGSEQVFIAPIGFEQAPDHLPVTFVVGSTSGGGRFCDGATVAMSAKAAISDLQLRIFAAARRVDYQSLTVVTMPFSEMGHALEVGEVDVASVPDPFATAIVADGFGEIVDRGTLSTEMPDGARVMITGVVSTRSWIRRHPERAAMIARAAGDAVRAYTEADGPGRDIPASNAPLPHSPAFSSRLQAGDLQLAFDLADSYGVVAGRLPAEAVIATP